MDKHHRNDLLSLYVILSLNSTSTSRSDRSAQAKLPSAMSSDSVTPTAEFSPELRVSSLHKITPHSCPSLNQLTEVQLFSL